jgi:alkanesulfonate monooxygenase SsuD/methylene tetrahydromethanopterin reductase-like flavin-dependent oxidoreductase (luciferase family)
VQLSGDRLDLGLGAGHMKSEFDDAGLSSSGARSASCAGASTMKASSNRHC